MKHLPLTRRTLLRGAAGTALALPWLEAMRPETHAHAQGALPPKRLIIFMSANGCFPERFIPMLPGQTEYPVDKPPASQYFSGPSPLDVTDFVLPHGTEPLERHRNDLIFLEGLNSSGNVGHGHWSCALTGRANADAGYTSGGGISLDQEVANHVGGDTKFKSLQLGVVNATDGGPLSWFGELKPALAENNPKNVLDRIFAEVGAVDTTAIDTLRRQRKSVLDAALGQLTDLQPRLGKADRDKLQNYADSIREVETRLLNTARGLSCGHPTIEVPTTDRWEWDPNNAPLVMKTQLDLLAMTLACDLTRVVTFSVGYAASGLTFPFLDIEGTWHDGLSHALDSDPVAQAGISKVDNWVAEQLASLIDRLKSIPEGDGTVFDNSVIVWMNEMSKGNSHDADNIPHVIAGSGRGYFKTGRYVRLERVGEGRIGRPHGRWSNDLLLTLLQSMDIPAATFGDPNELDGPLDILRA